MRPQANNGTQHLQRHSPRRLHQRRTTARPWPELARRQLGTHCSCCTPVGVWPGLAPCLAVCCTREPWSRGHTRARIRAVTHAQHRLTCSCARTPRHAPRDRSEAATGTGQRVYCRYNQQNEEISSAPSVGRDRPLLRHTRAQLQSHARSGRLKRRNRARTRLSAEPHALTSGLYGGEDAGSDLLWSTT